MTPRTFSFGVTLYPSNTNKNKKAELPQKWLCALYMGSLKNFDSLWVRPQLLYAKFLMCFCSDRSHECAYKILKFVALPVHEIEGIQKIGQSLETLTLSCLSNFSWALFGWTLWRHRVLAKFAARSFTRSWDNSYCSFELGLRTPNLGEGKAVGGRGWYRSKERWWVPIGHSIGIVTFHLSLRVSEILPLFVLQHATFPHPTSRLVSPKFHHVALGVGGYICDHDSWSTKVPLNVTDRQTEWETDGAVRRHAISIPRFALKCIAR